MRGDGVRRYAGLTLLAAAATVTGCGVSEAAQPVVGTWVPSDRDRGPESLDEPYVTFSAYGGFEGSDGCQSFDGEWAAGEDSFRADVGAMSGFGCPGSELVSWISDATDVEVAGDRLILYDDSGQRHTFQAASDAPT
ncbi:MAG: META domain-containing protein [Kineosporiaceae bacterium]